jgi:NADPH2:quinone reductase
MRAARVLRLDGPAGVEVIDVGEPVPAAGEALVEVHATGLAFPDLLLSQGKYQLKPELPFTLGIDYAGVVRTAPAGCAFASGDRVAGWGSVGGAAEVVSAPPDRLFPLPATVDFAAGACLPLNYLAAHYALVLRAGLRADETVLVHGGAGGVGTAAIQIAKAYGARVLAVTAPGRAAVAAAAGADEVLPADGFAARARELGVDVVLDPVGGDQLVLDSLRALNPLGRFLVFGFAGGDIASVKLNRLLLSNVDVRGVSWGSYTRLRPEFPRSQWDELFPHLASGALAPVVARVYPLSEVRAALEDLAGRRLGGGKAVLRLR